MSFYGMNDFPDGKITRNSFINENGKLINKGYIYNLKIPWGFINPFLEKKLYDADFYNKYEKNKGLKKEIDFNNFQKIIKENLEELDKIPLLRKWIHKNNTNEILKSKNKLKQSYMFMSLYENDYLLVKGKNNGIEEAYLFQIEEEGVIKYDKFCIPYCSFIVKCKIPDAIYKKLKSSSKEVWNLGSNDIKLIKSLINE